MHMLRLILMFGLVIMAFVGGTVFMTLAFQGPREIARSRVLQQGASDFPNIVLISVDPERDTPAEMAEYTAHFGGGVTGVTGSLTELRTLIAALGIFFEKSDDQNGDYTVGHSAAVIVINENAEFHALFSAPHNIDHFVGDIPLITESP